MVTQFTERLYVVNAGTVIASGSTRDVMTDAAVRDADLGEGPRKAPDPRASRGVGDGTP
jgi:ABC-type lipopolysaccharide export system ATPase subunit